MDGPATMARLLGMFAPQGLSMELSAGIRGSHGKDGFRRFVEGQDGSVFLEDEDRWRQGIEEDMHGLHFVYYTETTFGELVGDEFEIVETARYTEMEPDDSFYVVLRKRL